MLTAVQKAARLVQRNGWRGLMQFGRRRISNLLTTARLDKQARQDEKSRSHIPTMLKRTERLFLYQYASQEYTGGGEIVDLGSWLGGSTAPLAQGLARNQRPETANKRIHAYDHFIWSPWMNENFQGPRFESLRVGDSFVELFREYLGRWAHRVEPAVGDLNESGWSGQPVEMIFVDVMKSMDLANTVVQLFFPYLRPGLSRVVHQDFVHFNTPWILLLSHRFRDWLEPERRVEGSPSFVFKCVAEPPAAAVETTYDYDSFSEEESREAFDYCRGLLPTNDHASIDAAQATYYTYRGDLASAREVVAGARRRGASFTGELGQVPPRLRQVAVLRELLKSPNPLSADELVHADRGGDGVLSSEEVRLALDELSKLEYIEHIEQAASSAALFVYTPRALDWINSRFKRDAFPVVEQRSA